MKNAHQKSLFATVCIELSTKSDNVQSMYYIKEVNQQLKVFLLILELKLGSFEIFQWTCAPVHMPGCATYAWLCHSACWVLQVNTGRITRNLAHFVK